MIVFDLQCAARHVFEGWFAGEADFQQQCRVGLLLCPLCGNSEVSKRLSAPRLNFGTPAPTEVAKALDSPAQAVVPTGDVAKLMQRAWLQAAREIVANTEDVGQNFSHEARRIHYGEVPERGIRGFASADEAASLIDEGISVMPFAMPEGLKKRMQ